MFVNTKSAYKFAEECAAKQKAAKAKCDNTISSGSSSSDLTKTTKSGENDIIGEQVTIRPESKWLLERNENIKADAVTMIQDAITTQEGRKVKISDMIEHNAQIGSARLEGCNQRGTP
jgi:NDP-sugar pyrophosphorylase family protein